VMSEKFVAILNAFNSGDLEKARRLQTEADDVIRVIAAMNTFSSEKYLLGLQGIPFGECRRPFRPLNNDEKKKLDIIFETHLQKIV